MGWQNMQRLKTQMVAKRKMSVMIPNISKWKQLTRIKLRLYCFQTTTQEKPKLLSSTNSLNIRNSSVACSKAILLNIQKTEVFIYISIPKNSNRDRLRSCEDIISVAWPDTWQQSHTMERKFLCTWLVTIIDNVNKVRIRYMNYET